MKTLGGIMVIRDGFRYDYNFLETTRNLLELCDRVKVICFANSHHMEDLNALREIENSSSKLIVDAHDYAEWDILYKGKERIAEWQNMAKRQLGTDWYVSVQADEVIHEDSFKYIREAIEDEDAEAFLCRRYNLWGSPYTMLNVVPERKPCSDVVIRLARLKYLSYGDGESISAMAKYDFIDQIRIYHMGFVRKREVMKDKIFNMQENVFEIPHDPKLDGMDVFNPWAWFDKTDVVPIKEELPKVIQEWAKERYL